jgi:hypothetical protein
VTTTSGAQPASPERHDGVRSRRVSGLVMLGGAAVLLALVGPVLAFPCFPALTGLVLLAAALCGRRRSALWGPGAVLAGGGLVVVLWTEAGRVYDVQFFALVLMGLGAGGALVGALGALAGRRVTATSVALPVLGFGAFLLLEQQQVRPFAGEVAVYAGLLATWGVVELLRPARSGRRPTAR